MSHSLWTAHEAAAATRGRVAGEWRVSGVAIDSRHVADGDLFVALSGPNFDGHDFVAQALGAGAAAAMVARTPPGVVDDMLLVVDDTMRGLEALGRAARARSHARIAAVTGSAGKTGVKEALRLALEGQGTTAASAGSLNNHWGVPLSLARMAQDAAFGVFEAGMNHPGEIARLTRLIRPHVAIVTNVEAAHTAHFASLEEVCDAKAEIFEGVEGDGTAVLNRDSPFFGRLAAAAASTRGVGRIVSFGRDRASDVRLIEAKLGPERSAVRASLFGEEIDYTVGAAGPHWVTNSLAVLAAVAALGADPALAAKALARLAPMEGRGARREVAVRGGAVTVIDESYNANPASMRAAIATLGAARTGAGGRRIAVLGDMRELGPESPALHASLAAPLGEAGVDLVFTAGADMAALADVLPATMRGGHFADAAATAHALAAALRPGDVVMVKGSHASGMGAVVTALGAGAASRKRAANG